jgi:HEPN domain-containing protein
MKERTQILFQLAEMDLKIAYVILEEMPNQAAFHAQQCAEKSLKAVVWELNETEDEDELRSRIKHESIRAVTQVISLMMRRTMRESGYQDLEGKLLKQKNTESGKLTLLLYLASSAALDNVFELFHRMPISKEKDYWGESLEANLQPDPSFDERWARQIRNAGEFMDLLVDFLFSTMNVKAAGKLSEVALNPAPLQHVLQTAVNDLVARGQKDQANALTRAIGVVERLTGQDASFVEWGKLVIFWAPYLDAHAVRGRYPTGKEMKQYMKKKDGVRNLVEISKKIMEQSKAVLPLLSS